MIVQYLRSLTFTTILILTTAVWATVVALSGLFPRRYRWPLVPMWARFVLRLLRLTCGIDYVVEGRENLPGINSIVYLKHTSVWETIAQLAVFPSQCWVLKRELMWVPFLGWGLSALRPIAIDRKAHSTAVQQVVRQGSERLQEGQWVMIFPEGTRVPPGETRRFGLSGALLAVACDRVIVPVAHNAGDLWPRRSLLKKPGTIRMIIGPPIPTSDREPRAINAAAQAWVEGQMRQISTVYEIDSQ